jgi:glycosyltransferase involved in cell wall biosynthesis
VNPSLPHGLPLVSVILPCRNEEEYIGRCLESILASEYPRDRLQMLVPHGASTDSTGEVLRRYAAAHPSIVVLDNPQGSTPTALNLGIRAATGDIVIRMDAHVLYPPDYIPRLVAGLMDSGADNVGGVLQTLPAENTPIARAIALGISHPLGVGNSHFRIGTRERREVDTVPFGCYRREVFERIGLFDEELVRNQDDEFNFRLITRGGRILLLPEVSCRYFARRSLAQLSRMYYQYGYFKPLVARKVRRVMTVRQLVPALLVSTLVASALLSLWLPAAGVMLVIVASTYAFLVLGCAAVACRTHGLRCGAALVAVFPTLHLSYGVGFIRGIRDHLLTRTAPRAGALGLSR